MPRYRYRPDPIDAFRFNYPVDQSAFPDWLAEGARADRVSLRPDGQYQLNQLGGGFQIIENGEWIVCDEDYQMVVMDDALFNKSFEMIVE
ncbi:hypothetical protein [Rhizobium sp. ICMP 5592]|uniref:hypothetical protein n=1 Tax=Rhizobium sp. ICMP 5592 TaxID=2292445 RepID=UPI0012962FC2|nr:hypothetical protein [Rhizobium sp. ICMP 5592]MQB43372.1 hypothetical protein [Rhizobium sp. ICMP 5592]